MSSSFLKIKKDKKIRDKVQRNEKNVLLYKYLLFNSLSKKNKHFYFFNFIKKFHLNSSSSRVINRCIYTGRSKWVIKRYKISRIKFKELCDYGKLHGVRRASY